MTVVPVSRQAWYVRYNRVAAARQPVEQGGFTDIWPSDQHKSGFHGFFGSDGETRSSVRGRFLQKLVPLRFKDVNAQALTHYLQTAQTTVNSCRGDPADEADWLVRIMP
jgi:hypothetical protein